MNAKADAKMIITAYHCDAQITGANSPLVLQQPLLRF